MKKILTSVLALSMTLSLVACGNSAETAASTDASSSENVESSVSTETKKSAAETSEDEEPWVLVKQTDVSNNIEKEYYYNDNGDNIMTLQNHVEVSIIDNQYISYIYDENGNVVEKTSYSVEIQNNEFSGFGVGEHCYYTYDADGNPLTQTRYDADGNLVATTKYEYDNGRLSSKWFRKESDLTETTSVYDSSGNLISEDSVSDDSAQSSHTDFENGIITNKTYTYESGAFKTETYDDHGEILSSSSSSGELIEYEYQYNEDGNMTLKQLTITGRENEKMNGTLIYEWEYNENGQRISYTESAHSGDIDGIASRIDWEYEADGHSYKETEISYDWTHANGAAKPEIVNEYHYLPLNERLSEQGDVLAHYMQQDLDTGAEMYLFNTNSENIYLAIMKFVSTDNTGYSIQPYLVIAGEYYYMNSTGTTEASDVLSWPQGSLEFDGEDVLMASYDGTAGYHRFVKAE